MRVMTFTGTVIVLLLGASRADAGGLRTHLGEVVVENLQVGQTYTLADLANLSLRVTNTGEYRVNLKMEVLSPDEAELRHGAGPIPDPSWIALTGDSFTLDAGQDAVADIKISIPDEDRYLGKRFQFMIWSHTVPGEDGMSLATGLKSRIIFTTDSVRADWSSDSVLSSGNAAFSVTPEEIHLSDVPLGSRYDVDRELGSTLLIKNPSSDELTLKLHSRTVEGSMASLEAGWEDTPDPGYLMFSENEIIVAPRSERSVNLFVQVPANTGLQGKHLMFLIHVSNQTGRVATGVYVRAFVALRQ